MVFDIFGESWPLPIELIDVSPHGKSLYEAFEDMPTDLRFQTLSSLEDLLSVSVEKGSITKKEEKLTFTWLTPELQDDIPRKVTVTASLGPARRTFPMTVVPFPNPLSLEIQTYHEGKQLVANWTLRNNVLMDIDDLRFDLKTRNLQLTHGDPLPKGISKKEVLHGKLFFEYPSTAIDFQPQWNGYTIPVSIVLEAISRRGKARASFDSTLTVHPECALEVWIQRDPE